MPLGKTPKQLFNETIARKETLENAGYKVEMIWECDVYRQLKVDPQMKVFFNNLPDSSPLKFQDAFFGGRTMPFALRLVADGITQKIAYTDIMAS